MSPRTRTLHVVAAVALLLTPATVACGVGSVDVDEVGSFGPDTSGAIDPGRRVELDAADSMTVLGVPADEADLPPSSPGTRRFGFTFGGCVLEGVSYDVVDGRPEATADFDPDTSCAQEQDFVRVVDVAADELGRETR